MIFVISNITTMKKILSLSILLLTLLLTVQAQERGDTFTPGKNTIVYKVGCGAPNGIYVDEITATSATIHWYTNGAAYYKVQYYNVNDPRENGTLMTNLGSVAVDELKPCSTYKFVITAKCPTGVSKSMVQMFSTQGCK